MEVSKRGGYRPNAGRKKEGKVSVNLRLKPETKEALLMMAEQQGVNMGSIIDTLVNEMVGN